MNERIKELIIQAGLDVDGYGYPIWGSLDSGDAKKEFVEKFAELIVSQCLDFVVVGRDKNETADLIKACFGVE